MFNLWKPRGSVQQVAEAVWSHVEPAASTIAQAQNGLKYEECVFYMSFVMDMAIYSATHKKPEQMESLRNHFSLYVQQFAADHHCKLPPKGGYQTGSNIWEVHGSPTESEDTVLIVFERFKLYGDAMSRPWESGKCFPPALVLGGLIRSLDVSIVMAATQMYVLTTKTTVDFIKGIRISP
jgi:hypothetical protein